MKVNYCAVSCINCICVCVFAAFYDRSLRQESWYFIVILFHEYVSVFFPHSISSFLFNLITVTHDWTCIGYTFSNGIMVIPRSYIFRLMAFILISVYLYISFNSGYSKRMFYFWWRITCLIMKHGIIDFTNVEYCFWRNELLLLLQFLL